MKLSNYGTRFQVKVWLYLRKIPKGTCKTYYQVAKSIGKPLAVRAVANAIGKNPFPHKIPCHRVVRSNGKIGGYSGKGGIRTKKFLLKKEGIVL
jgi:methylated-DNA-[protein]-cysteine S-methyltransferase